MILSRLSHEPGALVDFYQETLEHLGAICERTWFDRLQFVAEGRAARPWREDGALHEAELHFPAPDTVAPRDAARDVFPGCPLTFRLAEAILPAPLPLERAVLAATATQPPSTEVAEKLWRAEWPEVGRWRLEGNWAATWHFSLVTLARCEIQAIDQHWSLHRLALALPGGESDPSLAARFEFIELASDAPAGLEWPVVDPHRWRDLLSASLIDALEPELATIRRRQENYLRRELERIDEYFDEYERELRERAARSQSGNTKLKTGERLAAATAEHARRRADQVQRHEIRVLPRIDALLLLGEPAWQNTVTLSHHGETHRLSARFVHRARRWFAEPMADPGRA